MDFGSLVRDKSALVKWIQNWIPEAYLELCQISLIELFRLSAVDYIRKKKFIIDGLLIRLMIRFLISYTSCWGASHPFPLLPLSTSRRYTNQVFLNSATPSQITTNDIYISSQVIFFIVWSHQPAVTNSMHFQSTYIPHLQHLQSEAHMESSQASAVGPFFEKKKINLLRPLAVFAEELHRGCSIIYPPWITLGLHQRSVLTYFNNNRNTRTNSPTT